MSGQQKKSFVLPLLQHHFNTLYLYSALAALSLLAENMQKQQLPNAIYTQQGLGQEEIHDIDNSKSNQKPQEKEKPENENFSSLIISMMKKLKKNSPLFKPIKKLKTSIQAVGGQDQVSFYQPTSTLIFFHFGLGNELDRQIIMNGTNLAEVERDQKVLAKEFVILPGKAFSFIEFAEVQNATKFVSENALINIFGEIEGQKKELKSQEKGQQKPQQKAPLFYFKQLSHKNLTRLTIFFYLNTFSHPIYQSTLTSLPNCPSAYNQSIPGLYLIEQIITSQEQLHLLKWLDSQPWQKLSNRRVQHYGYQFKYGRNQIDKEQLYKNLMPEVFGFLLKRLKKLVWQLSGQQIDYDQLTINDYFAGHGIPAHFDTHSPFEQYFVAVSMLSGIVMDWKKYDGTENSTFLKQRSVVVFSGEARYAWLHSIACRKMDKVDNQLKHRSRRISLTFRKIRHTPCTCQYFFFCDSQGYDQTTMKKHNPLLTKFLCQQNEQKLKKLSPQTIYEQFVVKAYNSFGYDFHNKVIPEVKQYLDQESRTTEQQNLGQRLVLDVGCGNGEYKKHLSSDKFYYFGVERCQVMLPIEEEFHMDGLKMGFRDGLFDIVLLIAVLHHFTTQEDRIRCLKEAKRVMSQSGVMYVTVFSYQEKKQQYPSQDILLDYCLPGHKNLPQTHQSMQGHKIQPINPQKQQGIKSQKGQIFRRYYHLIRTEQFRELVEKSGLEIAEIQVSKENIIAKIKKSIN